MVRLDPGAAAPDRGALTDGCAHLVDPATRALRISWLCLIGSLEFGAPLMVAACVLAGRAFPTQPVLVGAMCGLAAGIVADSGWRLTCQFTAPSHVLGAHTLAVAILAAAGAIVASVMDWFQWGRFR